MAYFHSRNPLLEVKPMKIQILVASILVNCAFAQTIVTDPGPAMPPPAAPAAAPDTVTIRQGGTSATLAAAAQRITFVKTDADDPKAAIANTLITQVGLNLLTMGMGSQMLRWNPYMGEAFQQFTSLGKGLFTGKGNDVKGFEYDTLPGLTAGVTLKPQPVEILMPLDPLRPSADFNIDSVQPVLLRLETRPEDQLRVMASHRIVIKQEKKGRFDLKPKSEREEKDVQQRLIPVELQRQPGNILRVTTTSALEPGEYALVLRAKSEQGVPTQNIALKPIAQPAPAANAASADPMAQMMAQAQMQQQQQQAAAPKGLFGLGKGPKAAPQPPPQSAAAANQVGFLAWDFRVIE
jgi:hypothetical protein